MALSTKEADSLKVWNESIRSDLGDFILWASP